MRHVPKLAYGRYVTTKSVARLHHVLRVHFPQNASIIFIGGYHGENTGDWAMSEALIAEADRRGIAARRFAMRDAPKLHGMSAGLVIGGGAVATADALGPVAAAWSANRFPVTFVGVDFGANLREFHPQVREMCKAATSIGLRHESQLSRVREWSRNPNTYFHSDIAFARPSTPTCQRDPRLVALNVLPVFHKLDGAVFAPGSPLEAFYHQQDSPLANQIKTVAHGYVDFITSSVTRFMSEGYKIIHLPFAPEDDAFARSILPSNVFFAPYTKNFARQEQRISSAAFLLPTRFHALIAGFRTLTPVVPLAYAAKVQELLAEFRADRNQVIDRSALSSRGIALSTVTVSKTDVAAAARSAESAIARAVTEACAVPR